MEESGCEPGVQAPAQHPASLVTRTPSTPCLPSAHGHAEGRTCQLSAHFPDRGAAEAAVQRVMLAAGITRPGKDSGGAAQPRLYGPDLFDLIASIR